MVLLAIISTICTIQTLCCTAAQPFNTAPPACYSKLPERSMEIIEERRLEEPRKSGTLTITSAVKQALKHNPDLNAMSYALQADRSIASAAKSGYMPKIDATSNLSRTQGNNSIATQTTFAASQLIYSGAGPRQEYKKSKAWAEATELEKAARLNHIRKETEKTFLQAWLIQKQAALSKAITASARKTFSTQKHQHKLKKIDRTLWLKNASDFAHQITAADEYHDDTQLITNALSFLMGEQTDRSNTNKRYAWNYKKKIAPLNPLDTYLHAAVTARPEVPRGLKRIAVEKWNARLAQGTRLPVITLNAQSSCNTQPANSGSIFVRGGIPEVIPSTGNITTEWSVNLGLSWSLFDGLVTHYHEQAAQANKMKEILLHEQKLLDIKREVHAAYFGFSKAQKRFKAQKLHLLQAANDMKLQEQNRTLGKITEAEYETACTTWHKARLEWLSSRVQVAQAECELQYACGYPIIS